MQFEADIPSHRTLPFGGNILEYLHAELAFVVYDRNAGAVHKTYPRALSETREPQEHGHSHKTSGHDLHEAVVGECLRKQMLPVNAHTSQIIVLEVSVRIEVETDQNRDDLGIRHHALLSVWCQLWKEVHLPSHLKFFAEIICNTKKISVTLLSVIMIQYLFIDTSKLLNISDITKRIGNFFKLPIQLFMVFLIRRFNFMVFLIPNSRTLISLPPETVVTNVDSVMNMNSTLSVMKTTSVENDSVPAFPWLSIVLIVYLSGIVVLSCREIISFLRLFRMIAVSEKKRIDGVTICRIADDVIAPFSWGNYIFMQDTELDNSSCIYIHEKAHTVQRHWIDVLFADLFCILLWYNPFAWMTRQLMKLNHEFEADEAVINSGIETYDYQRLLVVKAMGNISIPIANSFANR